MKFDLHTHSTASDGTLSPRNVWQCAVDQQLNLFALTDHDTLDGYLELSALSDVMYHDMSLISGIEVSSAYFSNSIHIVGLNVDVCHPSLLSLVTKLQQLRQQRAERMVSKLEKGLLLNGLYDRVLAHAGCKPWLLTRPHIARYLVEAGVVSNEAQAFKRWLAQGKKAYVHTDWPDYSDVVRVISESGGVSVLAHPLKYGKMTRTKIKAMLQAFARAGGHAVEVVYQQQSADDTRYLTRLCQQFGLHASGGSDYHGPHMPWSAVGKVPELPSECQPVWRLFN
ncbi:MAG: PHP domain-containing protein [Pseudomonadota bacterium]